MSKLFKWIMGGFALLFVIGAIGAAVDAPADTSGPAPTMSSVEQPTAKAPETVPEAQVEDPAPAATPASKAKPQPKPEPSMTSSQENAIESAQSYLGMGGFSRKGLIEQLSSSAGEGFPRADAEFAVDHLHPDWNKEAVKSAKSYLEMGGFSKSSLIEQLSSSAGEGFTPAQAQYAADTAY
jgi:Host cell surface-exposed lipoprotein